MSVRTYLIGAALCVAVGASAAWFVQGWRYGAELAELQAAHATVLEKQAQAVVVSVQAARDIEQRRTAAVENERDHALEQTQILAADLVAGRAVAVRLRRELGALRARHAGGDSASTDGGTGEPGGDPIGVLAVVLGELDDRAGAVGGYADQLRIAGLACERAYDRVRAE